MQILQLKQGTPEWIAHRQTALNASDAPVMLGISPYRTRSEFLHERATGIVDAEINPAVMRIFAEGHRTEALARPLAEKIIGEELYPMVGTDGRLSASFDGLTLIGDVAFEHKMLNDNLRAVFADIDTVAPEYREDQAGTLLPDHYRAQMEQQCIVSGCERILFMASNWSEDGSLIEERHCWYFSDQVMRERILAGWEQFERDLAEYVPPEIVETPKAEAIMALPALAVQIRGEIITSNLPAFKASAEKFISSIKTELKTDEDFVQADATVKFCKEAEESLEVAKNSALAQTASIDELMRTVDHIRDQLRIKRLALNSLVEARKKQIKESAVAERRQKYAEHVEAINNALGDVSIAVMPPDFVGAIKGLKTIASLYNALDTALANGKIAANAAAKDLREKLDWYQPVADEYAFLFSDLRQIIQKPMEDFQLAVTTRIAEHKRQEDEKEAKRKADEAAAQQVTQSPTEPAATVTLTQSGRGSGKTASAAPTLRLGQINERLAPIALTADGLAALGFKHAATDKAAKLYHESDFLLICDALIERIEASRRLAVGQKAA